MPRAIISVSDKAGVVEFGAALADLGWEIVSTGGTAAALREGNVPVTDVGQVTDFPEMLGGRVKTLHPLVHGGILARRGVPSDMEQLREGGIAAVDLVAVNLYPFRKTIARESVTLADALEQIDIGGPTMLRAAAKNHESVWAVCDPSDYDRVLAAISAGEDEAALRRSLATKVFRHTATYDAAIAWYLGAGEREAERDVLPPGLMTSLTRVQSLRYGENPDQQAAFYRDSSRSPRGIPALTQLHGKELSYNNLLDVDGALGAISSFWDADRPACVIVKHTTPCGIAVGRSSLEAYQKAHACDPTSAFGSVIAFTESVTESVAEALTQLFVECVVAPGYADSALLVLQAKKSLRILQPVEPDDLKAGGGHLWPGLEVRGIRGGLLVQSAPEPVLPLAMGEAPAASVPTSRSPSKGEWADLAFAWAAVQSVKSNAILLAREGASIGIGAGQMSRVDAVRLAVEKARDGGHELKGSVLASDAFFPFRDGVDAAADAGVTAIVQPGGSVRDEEAVAAADEHGLAMVLTGRRLFRH